MHFDELSPVAKERARDWFRSNEEPADVEYILDDFAEVCAKLGLTLDLLPEGSDASADSWLRPAIAYSVGFVQSDYVLFAGRWDPQDIAPDVFAWLAANWHRCGVLLDLATRLDAIALCTARISYSRNYLSVEVEPLADDASALAQLCAAALPAAERALPPIFRALARWLRDQLQDAVLYAQSDECVDATLVANEYTFDADGRLV